MMTRELPTNDDRAAGVADYLEAFARSQGLDPDIDADGPRTVAGDMICNILHWVAQNDPEGRVAALDTVRNGLGHYVTESYIDYDADCVDELGPDSHVEIHADCDGEHWQTFTGCGAEIIGRR